MDLLLKHVVRETLDGHIDKMFISVAAADRFSKSSWTSSSLMTPAATFAKLKTDTTMEDEKCSTICTSNELIGTVETYKCGGESMKRHSESVRDETPRRK